MLNFEQLNDKISSKGYRRTTTARTFYDENGNGLKVYDYEHRKKLDMFSVYLNEYGSVEYAEFTKVDFNQETRKFSQQVKRAKDTQSILKLLG